jgi:hypothetical protein
MLICLFPNKLVVKGRENNIIYQTLRNTLCYKFSPIHKRNVINVDIKNIKKYWKQLALTALQGPDSMQHGDNQCSKNRTCRHIPDACWRCGLNSRQPLPCAGQRPQTAQCLQMHFLIAAISSQLLFVAKVVERQPARILLSAFVAELVRHSF